MKSNSYNNRAAVAGLMAVIIAAGALLWPATGHSQTSSRRDRSRRDATSRSSSSGKEQARPQVSERKTPVTKSVQPSAAGTKPAVAAPPAGPNETTAPRQNDAGPSLESSGDEATGPWARYGIILQRNVFSRQRTPFRPKDKTGQPQVVATPNPETHFVLKGIVQEDNQFIAFIEDTQGGGVQRLRQGDRVARGAIKTLSLDALEYQLEDKTIRVQLGCDLEGTRSVVTPTVGELLGALPVSAPASAPASAAPSAGQPAQTPAPAGNEAEILKRLMEQRRQQLGQ